METSPEGIGSWPKKIRSPLKNSTFQIKILKLERIIKSKEAVKRENKIAAEEQR